MTDDEARVIVVRAWRDIDRSIIRVIAAAGVTTIARQWAFSDVAEACKQIEEVIRELDDGPPHEAPRRTTER
ncbi:hypothetical protein [Rhodococcus tukisamuensis]|uniref:Uncharacterized protein n=1 Tax=Rhodococcus tukisamuensis TaxID=168276 RepID=A0A1G6RFB0_9NOCA|nr:hypothetical protein [Rhodococcus tukisamuensis]SDD02576.1 hypothetical protein SAMN05444580_102430 [Rhodococcus tukisamuensis]